MGALGSSQRSEELCECVAQNVGFPIFRAVSSPHNGLWFWRIERHQAGQAAIRNDSEEAIAPSDGPTTYRVGRNNRAEFPPIFLPRAGQSWRRWGERRSGRSE